MNSNSPHTGLLFINPKGYKVELSAELLRTRYKIFDQKEIRLPADVRAHPSPEALLAHRGLHGYGWY